MTYRHFLLAAWSWDPSVVVGCAALLGGYVAAFRFHPPRRAWIFGTGVLVLLLALVSPLDPLSDTYLFSAHMAQHLLLELVVPPLLLLGFPPEFAQAVVTRPGLGRIEGLLGRPAVAWLTGLAVLYIWHAPALYDAALGNENIHAVQHLSFLVTATIFWWPVFTPLTGRRLSPLGTVLYLMGAGMANGVLGILLGYAPRVLYPVYLHPPDPFGLLPLLRDRWGLTPLRDQQLGGLLMAVPGGLVYAGVSLVRVFRWLSGPEWRVPAAGGTPVPGMGEKPPR